MIEHTFQLIPSVGAKKEMAIWEAGTLTWDDFLNGECPRCVKPALREKGVAALTQAAELLDDGDTRLLGDMVPKREHWRMFDRFKADAAYLDIETDGLSRDALVTVVTVHRPGRTVTLTEGIDLDAASLSDALDGAKILVTFNGSCFDVPVLRNSFPGVDFDMPQFDLRFASKKVGYSGGLKHLEVEMGIMRDEDIVGVDGAEAVHLWHQWARHGDEDALEILTEYNRADTINLETIAERIYGRLVTDYAGYRWRPQAHGQGHRLRGGPAEGFQGCPHSHPHRRRRDIRRQHSEHHRRPPRDREGDGLPEEDHRRDRGDGELLGEGRRVDLRPRQRLPVEVHQAVRGDNGPSCARPPVEEEADYPRELLRHPPHQPPLLRDGRVLRGLRRRHDLSAV